MHQTFANYKMFIGNDNFANKIQRTEGWYIWNVYKQLTQDIFDRAADLYYGDIEINFSNQVIDKIRANIMKLGEDEKAM